MNHTQLKLAIIKKVSSCEDKELLQTIYEIMQNINASPASDHVMKNPKVQASWEKTDVDDLQSSIDEIFEG